MICEIRKEHLMLDEEHLTHPSQSNSWDERKTFKKGQKLFCKNFEIILHSDKALLNFVSMKAT